MKKIIAIAFIFSLAISSFNRAAIGQTAERYIVLEGSTATAHVFNVSDNSEIASIKAGNTPTAAVLSGSRLAFVANINSVYVSVIDLTIQAEIKRIRGVRFGQLAITPDGSTVIGADLDDFKLKLIDAASLSVVREINLLGQFGDDPSNPSLTFGDPVVIGNSVYLNTNFGIGFVDLSTGMVTLVSTATAGNSTFTENLAGTQDGKFVIAVRAGALLVIDTTTNTVVNSFSGFFGCVGASLNSASPDVAFVVRSTGSGPRFSILNVATGSFVGDVVIPVAFNNLNTELASNSDGSRVYVGATTTNPNVLVIDTTVPAIAAQFTVGVQAKGAVAGFTQTQPPASAPVVTGVSPTLITNDASSSIQISGSGFASDAQVRLGSLDPLPAQVTSASQLQVTVPPGEAAQGAAVIVTNPDVAQGPAQAQQSGILRNTFIIASAPAFQPATQAAVANLAESTISILNVSTNATLTPTIPVGAKPISVAVTPDGSRAFIGDLFAPAAVDVYNFISNSVEAHIVLNGAPRGVPGQTKGVVIAPRFGTGALAAYVAAGVPVAPGPDGFTQNLYVIGADPSAAGFETVVATIPTGAPHPGSAPGSLAVTSDGHYAFLQAFELDTSPESVNLVAIDLSTGVSSVIPGATLGFTGFEPDLELSPDNRFLVIEADDGHLQIFDVGSNPFNPTLVAAVGSPGALLGRIVGNKLYAFDLVSNLVAIFNFNPAMNDFAQLGTFTVPGTGTVFGIAFDVTSDGSLMYIPLKEDDAVAVVDTAKVIANDPTALAAKIATGVSPAMAAVRPGTPTPAGTNVPVQPIPQVTINFSNVVSGGATTATTTNTNPDPLPAGFSLGTPPIYYEISSTATFSGPVQVCISYNPAQFTPPENNIRLLHDEGGTFVDVTTSLDTTNHVVCGQVTHFSAFTVGVANVDFFFNSLLREISSGITDAGTRQSLSAKAQAAKNSFDGQQNGAAQNQLNAFENEVDAQSGKKISVAEANRLLQMANAILARL